MRSERSWPVRCTRSGFGQTGMITKLSKQDKRGRSALEHGKSRSEGESKGSQGANRCRQSPDGQKKQTSTTISLGFPFTPSFRP